MTEPIAVFVDEADPHIPESCIIACISNILNSNRIIYIKIDTSAELPAGGKVLLHLMQDTIGPGLGDAYFQRTTEEWNELNITWDDQPDYTTDNQYIYEIPNIGWAWREFDITDLYADAKIAGTSLGIRICYVENTGTRKTCFRNHRSEQPPYIEIIVPAPTISSISWSPKGDYATIPSGATLVGNTEDLKVASMDPAHSDIDQGEAMLALVDKGGTETAIFTVAEGDHFRFDNKEWWALNIICGPECDIITIADEVAEVERIPKIEDEIQFTCNIDWHDQEPQRVEWYYAKAPDRCFTKDEVNWKLFASEQFPLHTFAEDGDEDITFLKVLAKNAAGITGESESSTCTPIFNLWKPSPGFMEDWLIDAFMAFILEGLAETTEYFGDLVFDGDIDPDTPSSGFSLLWDPTTFVIWIAEEVTELSEDMFDIVFDEPAEEETSGYSIFWVAAEFAAWLYVSIAVMAEDILDLVFVKD